MFIVLRALAASLSVFVHHLRFALFRLRRVIPKQTSNREIIHLIRQWDDLFFNPATICSIQIRYSIQQEHDFEVTGVSDGGELF